MTGRIPDQWEDEQFRTAFLASALGLLNGKTTELNEYIAQLGLTDALVRVSDEDDEDDESRWESEGGG